MNQAWLGICVALVGSAGCAGSAEHVRPPPARAEPVAQAPSAESSAASTAKPRATVAISGIEGSMSSYDVRATMEQRAVALAACHEPRARIVPALSGSVEFAIEVDSEGRVGNVVVNTSDLGDRTLERCVSELIRATPFPRPNGGDARVTWTMILEPTRAGLLAETWDAEQIERVITKHLPTLQSDCVMEGKPKQFDVIAYVNRRGRIVAAGVSTRSATDAEDLDCIVKELRSWPMPKPKSNRFAKVSFTLASNQVASSERHTSRKHAR